MLQKHTKVSLRFCSAMKSEPMYIDLIFQVSRSGQVKEPKLQQLASHMDKEARKHIYLDFFFLNRHTAHFFKDA